MKASEAYQLAKSAQNMIDERDQEAFDDIIKWVYGFITTEAKSGRLKIVVDLSNYQKGTLLCNRVHRRLLDDGYKVQSSRSHPHILTISWGSDV